MTEDFLFEPDMKQIIKLSYEDKKSLKIICLYIQVSSCKYNIFVKKIVERYLSEWHLKQISPLFYFNMISTKFIRQNII